MEKRPRVGVGIVVVQGNQVLLGKRKGSQGAGTWGFPGGHLEFGETVEECATRELAEETGLKALSVQCGPWTNNRGEEYHYITLFTFVHHFEGEPKLVEPEKCEGWEWFNLDALPSPLFHPIEALLALGNGKLNF